ncbi:MAG: GNAT family N-acetyltransferase [Angustibacter sp.]
MDEPELPLRTERLVLRLHEAQDADALRTYYGDPEVVRYVPFDPWDDRSTPEHMARRLTRRGLTSEARGLGVVAVLDGRVVGDVALWTTDDAQRLAEIGWAFHPDVAGQGLATEAATAVLDVAFGSYGLHRVAAQLDPRNVASARLCERLGMRLEAHLRQNWWDDGEWTDSLIYGLLESDRTGPQSATSR